jgi:hypothetical protein
MYKAYHTCTYVYDTYSSGNKPYGKYRDSVGFYSAAKTFRGLVKAADNAAFWDVASNDKGHYCRVVTVDGNAI